MCNMCFIPFQLKLSGITSSQLETCSSCGHPRKVKSDAPKPPKLLKDPKAEKEAKEAKAEAKAAAEEKTMELLKDMC